MAGSRGTLGVLSEVSFKVLPRPEAVAVVLLTGLSIKVAVAAMSSALTSPFDVSGAAHVPVGLDGEPVTMIRVEGFEDSTKYRAEKLAKRLAGFGAARIERRLSGPESTKAGWEWIRDAKAFAGGDRDVWRFSIRPGDAPDLIDQLGDAEVLLDWGGGLVWAACAPGCDLRVPGLGGHATLVRAVDETKAKLPVFQPEAAPLAKLAADLRAKFDPKGVLNQGLMG